MIKNKLNTKSNLALYREEEKITKLRAIEMYDSHYFDDIEIGTLNGLCQIHKYLFEDVYDFAGEVRDVNMAKGNFRFTPVMFLVNNLKQIEKMPEDDFDKIIEKYVEMNVAHPFREGNGRAGRIWLDLMLKKNLGLVIDWSKVDKEEYLSSMERSPVNDLEIKTLLRNALTDDINDRDVYMKGIDNSYHYENMDRYTCHELDENKE